MKTLILLTLALIPVNLSASEFGHGNSPNLRFETRLGERRLPDIPPDADSSFYLSVLGPRLMAGDADAFDGLNNVVSLGERNLKWLEHINSFRPDGQKLSLTSKDTQRGIPITAPNEYNPTLVQSRLGEVRAQFPEAMAKVIFGNEAFTREPPVKLEDYLTWSRELDRVFQTALRWRTMAPWLSYLAGRRHNDLRGWYFLSRMQNRAEKLRNWAELGDDQRALIRSWLANMCFNQDENDTPAECLAEVDAEISRGRDLEAYYQAKAAHSASMFNGYFRIPNYAHRPEVRWLTGKDGKPMVIAPFLDPGTAAVRSFLKDNIEDEWRFQDWHLEMPFQSTGAIPKVVFRPGVTPNVNGLGGDTITMNSQQPLTEYDAQWTIRHEYGHVLGFPDCYVEFYESERNVIVNYQFDIENLMCSRRGHLQATHLEEMKRVYSR